MDPVIVGIISGLVVEGLKGIIRLGPGMANYDFETLFGDDELQLSLEGETSLKSILAKSIDSLSYSGELTESYIVEGLADFLASPEVEAVVRQIYAGQLVGESSESLEIVRREFAELASLQLKVSADDNHVNRELFDTLLAGCDKGLQIAVDNGVLAAHEARSSLRYHMLYDELATLQKNVEFLTQGRSPDVPAILDFEEKYRQQVTTRYGTITPPYVDVARRLPIDELYVSPSFSSSHSKKGEDPEEFRTPELLSAIYRAVLLGNPGSGKSTFTHKLSYDLATHYSKKLFAGRQLTPILVVLRDYGNEKKTTNCSILQFIEKKANADHQLEPPINAFKYLLLNGRALVIFDGLDELLDTSYRQEISRDVESFCTLYPSTPVLITSREVGYEQAPLDERRFEIFRLSGFDDEQVQEYATKWFAVNTDLTVDQRRRETATFLVESRIVPDLRANPLMLGLMCNIYRGENYIPRNRPDVYRKCAEMLFERWDRSRGIHYSLPFIAHVRPTMIYLAHWIYSEEALQGGATEQQLITKAAEYLYPDRFDDRDEAAMAAHEFIEFCRGRAWVFTDTGTTSSGERLYQFTHRTFLEYFTAQYLTRTYYTPDRLIDVLLPKIAKREWDIVAQLAFQIQSEAAAGAGDELLSTLIEQANKQQDEDSWNLLSFSVRCLEFMVPSTKVRANVTISCVQHCISWGADQLMQGLHTDEIVTAFGDFFGPTEILASLQNSGVENRATVLSSLESLILDKTATGNEYEANAALEVVISLSNTFLFHTQSSRNFQQMESEVWTNLFNRLLAACSIRLKELSINHFQLCYTALSEDQVTIEELMKWHGPEALFQDRRYIMIPIRMTSLAEQYLSQLYGYLHRSLDQDEDLEYTCRNVSKIGHIALSVPLPWVRIGEPELSPFFGFLFENYRDKPHGQEEAPSLNAEVLFGAFVLLATLLELETKQSVDTSAYLLERLKDRKALLFGGLRRILISRFESPNSQNVETELAECGFTTKQQTLTKQWVQGEVDFVHLKTTA